MQTDKMENTYVKKMKSIWKNIIFTYDMNTINTKRCQHRHASDNLKVKKYKIYINKYIYC